MRESKSYKTGKVCEKCGYRNLEENYKKYGTCTRCRSVIDEKAKFKYEMNKKLRLWRNKFK